MEAKRNLSSITRMPRTLDPSKLFDFFDTAINFEQFTELVKDMNVEIIPPKVKLSFQRTLRTGEFDLVAYFPF